MVIKIREKTVKDQSAGTAQIATDVEEGLALLRPARNSFPTGPFPILRSRFCVQTQPQVWSIFFFFACECKSLVCGKSRTPTKKSYWIDRWGAIGMSRLLSPRAIKTEGTTSASIGWKSIRTRSDPTRSPKVNTVTARKASSKVEQQQQQQLRYWQCAASVGPAS